MATWDTEIRKLEADDFFELCRILNQNDVWKELMKVIPLDDNQDQCRFSSDHVAMIEQAMKQQKKGGGDIFLLEYGTMGRKRPTCRTLYQNLIKANLIRAADYISLKILKVGPAERPETGPAARIDTSEETLKQLKKRNLDDAFRKVIHELPTRQDHWSPQAPKTQIKSNIYEKPIENSKQIDLIEFSQTQPDLKEISVEKSDMIKFSVDENVVESKNNESTPEKASQNEEAAAHPEEQDYVLKELQSEDIPLCVKQDASKSNVISVSVSSQEYESTITVETSDCSQPITDEESIVMPAIEQHNIPIVVLEYNERKGNTDA
ncbi:hypothetical protein QAD02_019014 [Eretmocerus hayati]|uniref:Uncharacterized protein n=1 Tax=Eretmocerus hayati TaxID=131215 RepID=A0ACC2PIE5_9HYME|nr:hypothetical protein QAD02_019014 [Eretmocerus hayati]